jgi:Tol biopolymer transport system component
VIFFNAIRNTPSAIWEIDTLDERSLEVRCLTDHGLQDCLQPRPTSDGRRVAFVSAINGRERRTAIFVLDQSTSILHRLTGADCDHDLIGWLPDGEQLGFLANSERDYHMYLMKANGANAHRVNGLEPVRQASFSPDGTRAAMVLRYGDSQVIVSNLEDASPSRLTRGPDVKNNPAWSSDGKFLAMASSRTTQTALLVVDLETGQECEYSGLTSACMFAWAPNGKRIAILGEKGMKTALYVIDLQNDQKSELVTLCLEDENGSSVPAPVWSPGGGRIAYVNYADGGYQIEMADLSDGAHKRLTTGAPSFSQITDLHWV